MRIIDADKVVEQLKEDLDYLQRAMEHWRNHKEKYVSYYGEVIGWRITDLEYAINTINDALTIEVERKIGRWIKEKDRHNRWHCSKCKYVIGVMKMDAKYCPNCGAKMESKT